MSEIEKILKVLREAPVNVPVCKSDIGSGEHASELPDSPGKYKPIVKGDFPDSVRATIRYLFFDLAIDLGIEIDEGKLIEEIYGPR